MGERQPIESSDQIGFRNDDWPPTRMTVRP
jgi:hypothetical protein